LHIQGVDGEANGHPANFGILVSGDARTHSNWVIIGNAFPNVTAALGGGTAVVTIISQVTWLNNTNESTGGGISFNGTLDNLYVDNTAGGVAAGLITNQWVLPTN